MSSLARFLSENSNIWGAVLILIGAFFCLFGRALLGLAVFLATSGMTFLFGVYFCFKGFDYFELEPSDTIFWTIIGCWALGGAVVGFCFYKLQKYGVVLLATVAGLLVGHIITAAILVDNEYLYWAIIISCPAAMCFTGCFCQNNIRILFTSLIGAYAITRGIASYLGGFPNEFELQKQLKSGYITWKNFPKSFYLYFVAFFCIVLLSVCFQRWHLKNTKGAQPKKQSIRQNFENDSLQSLNRDPKSHVKPNQIN